MNMDTFNELWRDKYNFIEKIGEGTYGRVYKVKDVQTQEKVAVKILFDEDELALENDSIYLQKVGPHTNIIRMLSTCYDNEKMLHYIFLEYHSCNLEIYIDRPYFSVEQIYTFTCDILDGLEYIHNQGFIHGDIKPKNILISNIGTAIICDFGHCHLNENKPSPPYFLQTLGYRAPEIILDLPYDYKIDVWSLGCTFLEMFSKKNIFSGHQVLNVLSIIENVLGSIPYEMLSESPIATRYYYKEYINELMEERYILKLNGNELQESFVLKCNNNRHWITRRSTQTAIGSCYYENVTTFERQWERPVTHYLSCTEPYKKLNKFIVVFAHLLLAVDPTNRLSVIDAKKKLKELFSSVI